MNYKYFDKKQIMKKRTTWKKDIVSFSDMNECMAYELFWGTKYDFCDSIFLCTKTLDLK